MRKVVHIITDTNIGGAGHHMLALLGEMCKNGNYSPEVILPENSRLVPLIANLQIPFHEVPHIADMSYSKLGVKVLYKKLKEIAPDIVHTHASFSGRIAAKKYRRCRIVHTLHCAFPVAKWRKMFPMRQLFGFMNNRYSHRMIAVSPVAEKTLLEMGAKKRKIQVIYNGVPPARQYSNEEALALRDKYSIPHDSFVVAFIARLTEIKGHDYVLDMARELPFNVIILCAGDGEYQAHLQARIKKEGLENNVRLLGFVENIPEILAIMDVQINMSYVSETTSLSLLSGMSVGKPAIVTRFGGNTYVIEDKVNGLLIPPQSPEALDEAITRLKEDNDLYSRLATGAKARYNEQFTAERLAAETERLYSELV